MKWFLDTAPKPTLKELHKEHLQLSKLQIAFIYSKTYPKLFGTHDKALKEVETQVFGTHAQVPKEVETAHNLSLIVEANACPVVPRFPQNTSLKRKVQSAKAQTRRRDIHEQVWSLRSQGWSGQGSIV